MPQPEAHSASSPVEQFILDNDVHYVLKLAKYFFWRHNEWIAINPHALKRYTSDWTKEFSEALTLALQQMGRIHKDLTFSYRDLPSADYFNLCSRKGWLQPASEQHHWLFDVLIDTLSGGKAENAEHLMRVLCYKYRHPGEFRLPCLLLHGEGGIGKNLLVDRILYALFDGQTVSLLADNALGQFNSLIKGKAVALVDESAADDTSRSKVKSIVHNARLTLNEKGIPEVKIDNTPLWLIGTNESEGGLFLDRSEADRRFSVIHIEKGRTLIRRIADTQGWSLDEARQWMLTEGNRISGDPQEVARWLGHLVGRFGNHPLPVALHGEDFRRLMNIQKPPHETIAEAVFQDLSFTHIERKVLFMGYKACALRAGKKAVAENKFGAMIDSWLKVNRPDVVLKEVWYHLPRKGRRVVWHDTQADERVIKQDNANQYLSSSREWIGPD